MRIQMIAVDMDGTFLNDRKDYNRDRFREQYAEMKRKGIRFVVASGNQYYQLRSFFPEIEHEIAFVAENGAYIVDGNEEVFTGRMSTETIAKTLEILKHYPSSNIVICGKQSAYMHHDESDDYYDYSIQFYHRLKRVEDLTRIEDQLFKFALRFPLEDLDQALVNLKRELGEEVNPVACGHGDVDIIVTGIHKAHGIQLLQQRWQIADDKTVAFGDSGNDIEMLRHAHYSYAMEHASDIVKRAAKYQIGSNNAEAVLDAIDSLL
ncbi:Cof-type HAD-IIB family hydrolase [Paenibacillus terrigena]|uniref:Cof-type HAD-IIB family hydrolase n=1 Tax=Paenibacillus terrigena TaxID=369333 RepID=UPI0028D7A39C|nr:Cof-type HAD-IIB family hydrolase [Paenibacillus terrigena]